MCFIFPDCVYVEFSNSLFIVLFFHLVFTCLHLSCDDKLVNHTFMYLFWILWNVAANIKTLKHTYTKTKNRNGVTRCKCVQGLQIVLVLPSWKKILWIYQNREVFFSNSYFMTSVLPFTKNIDKIVLNKYITWIWIKFSKFAIFFLRKWLILMTNKTTIFF